MDFTLNKRYVKAKILFNSKEGTWTIYTLAKGHPVITADSQDKAKEEFSTALLLSSAIRNFLLFNGANKSQTEHERISYIEGMKERIENIEYTLETV